MKLSQYRMLGRALRGERLPLARFNTPTTRALVRRRCFEVGPGYWVATEHGKKKHADQKPRMGPKLAP